MSRLYRQSRNIEASVIDRIQNILIEAGFTVGVEKTFTNAYKVELPVIVVRVGDTIHEFAELSTTNTKRTVLVLIDIFASSDGQRLDLKDCLISYLKSGIDYYEYSTGKGEFQTKTKNGRMSVFSILDKQVFPDVNKSTLDEHDKWRHLITLNLKRGTIE